MWLEYLVVFLGVVYSSAQTCLQGSEAQCCEESLRIGQYYCVSPSIDLNSQSVEGCSRIDGLVNVSCYAAPNVSCTCQDGTVMEYDEERCVFLRQRTCRYVNGQRYDYRVAVALSLFLGVFGIDRFYLGYPAIGLLKLCTLGFFFIGHYIDFLLILVQTVGPADRTGYYIPFYGPLLQKVNTTNALRLDSDTICTT